MKSPNIGDYLMWDGKPGKIIDEIDKRQVVIELLEDSSCPHCGESLGKRKIHSVIASSHFQDNAEKLPTIIDDETLIVK